MNEKFAERLKQLRLQHGLTQKELAKVMGVSSSAVGMWEIGRNEPDYKTLKRLADFFKVSIDYLLGKTDDPTPPQKRLEDYPWYRAVKHIPVYNGANAGNVGSFPDGSTVLRWIGVPKNVPADFAIVVHGDSMEPKIHDGDIVVVSTQRPFINGELVVVIIDGEAYVKRLWVENNRVVLQSENPRYKPIVLSRRQVNIYLVGRVVGVYKEHL